MKGEKPVGVGGGGGGRARGGGGGLRLGVAGGGLNAPCFCLVPRWTEIFIFSPTDLSCFIFSFVYYVI